MALTEKKEIYLIKVEFIRKYLYIIEKNIHTVAVISSLYAILVTVSDIHSFPLVVVMFSSDFKSNSNPEFVIYNTVL